MKPRYGLSLLILMALAAGALYAQIAPLTIVTNALADGTVGEPYSQFLSATGAYGNYSWTLVQGVLPPGLTLLPTGVISGTPTAVGSYPIVVQVSSSVPNASVTLTKPFTLVILTPMLSITTSAFPDGVVGVAYSANLAAKNAVLPYTWAIVQGSLPAGLKLSAATGLISGTPTAAGTFSFVAQVRDSLPDSTTRGFSITILTAPPLSITTTAIPDGMVGVAYPGNLVATGGVQPYKWSIVQGSLPAGLTLNATTGIIGGTPTAAGTFSFVAQVLDAQSNSAMQSFSITILAAVKIATTSPLPSAAVGSAYSLQLAATGGTPPDTWTAQNSSLPPGLSLGSSGLLGGTPTTTGTFTFSLTVTDYGGYRDTASFTMIVVPALAITTTTALPDGAAGAPYDAQLAATGGTAPYTWVVFPELGTLPAGVTLDTSSGRLSGTPSAAGNYSFSIRVTDSGQRSATKAFTISISNALTILTKPPLANGTAGSVYQQQLTATGGKPPYTWSISAGALPAGLTLGATTGIIGGTPSRAGTFNITVAVNDGQQTATASFGLNIGVPAVPGLSITVPAGAEKPATQPTLGIALSDKYPLEITGQATLTFTPDIGADDPAVQFTTGGRTASFLVPVGATQAPFSLQTGTVAGTITVTTRILAAGLDITPTPAPSTTIRIAKAAPVITSIGLTRTGSGFDLVVVGYSTPRDMTSATVGLTASPGTELSASQFTISLTGVFTTWYQAASSATYGSQFRLRIPFTVQNVSNAVSSLSVSLANSQGASAVNNASF